MATAARTSATHMKVTPLTGSIGAEVSGVDLAHDISSDDAEAIRHAFAEHLVLVFRCQGKATPESQNRLAALFGEPQPLEVFQFLGRQQSSITFDPGSKIVASEDAGAPEKTTPIRWEDLQNIGLAGDFDGWHIDSSFTHWIPHAAVLRAETIPPVGGDTGFASLCAAYDGLSPLMQEWLAKATAIHHIPPGFKEGIGLAQYGADAEARFDAEFPPREWPLVIRHPVTGRNALFVNPGYTVHINGLNRRESHALLRMLCQHVASTSFTYRHHWHPGDLVAWDEVHALHRAPDDFAPHERKVVRVTAGRAVPLAAFS
ncbi:MAG: TauD/TfdA dioxygenase family protein [Novosphingobium sp.]